MVRHILLIKVKDGSQGHEIEVVKDAFQNLPSKIPGVKSVEWGVNNSPEGKNAGFTHSVLMTFENDQDRDIYLEHPEHFPLTTPI